MGGMLTFAPARTITDNVLPSNEYASSTCARMLAVISGNVLSSMTFAGLINISTLHVIVFGKSSPVVMEHDPPFFVNTSLGMETPLKRRAVRCGVV